MKRKHLILVIAFILINIAFLLSYNSKNWFSTKSVSAAILNVKILTSSGCINEETTMSLQIDGDMPPYYNVGWNYGDGTPTKYENGKLTTTHVYKSLGPYTVTASLYYGDDPFGYASAIVAGGYCDGVISETCCDGSFAPIPGKKYIISAWVKETGTNSKSFENGYLTLGFGFVNAWKHPSQTTTVLGPYYGKGNIIDGWQRIEDTFTVPADAETMSVRLNNQGDNDNVFFDDIRVYPFDGNMKSYVYDPDTKRLVAEMDQNNYATVYEYNEEGEMIRVKKETERGIMTITESRSGIAKRKD